ncbi:hypothetical protein SAMN04487968_101344 [Nocardioides terrae]|uniref:Uncharacterized protein n=1 Tax=Nocardioides terrae TaxID=574651 RepID=A0A1I1DLM8_9ACTN|nr:hypothetical protein [Nocardioides terrae]SFB75757.1 hypothetical protein SAMN04487968_101344 [Nocardioides terrae]
MTSQTEEPDEFEPETKVDPADGIWEGDAIDVVESEETDDREIYVDAERLEEPVDPDEEDEEL